MEGVSVVSSFIQGYKFNADAKSANPFGRTGLVLYDFYKR